MAFIRVASLDLDQVSSADGRNEGGFRVRSGLMAFKALNSSDTGTLHVLGTYGR